MLKWEQFLALDSFAHLQTRSTMYVSQLGQSMVLPLHTSLLTSRSVKTRTGTGRGFFLSSLKQPTFLQLKAQPVSSDHKIVHVNRVKRQTREKFPCTIHWPGYKTHKRKWILSEELMIKGIKNICEIKQTKAVAVRDFFSFKFQYFISTASSFSGLSPGRAFQVRAHYGTAPGDPCRPQNRGSHDYLRAHKGSRCMSRPLIQDSSVSVLFPRYKGNLT